MGIVGKRSKCSISEVYHLRFTMDRFAVHNVMVKEYPVLKLFAYQLRELLPSINYSVYLLLPFAHMSHKPMIFYTR